MAFWRSGRPDKAQQISGAHRCLDRRRVRPRPDADPSDGREAAAAAVRARSTGTAQGAAAGRADPAAAAGAAAANPAGAPRPGALYLHSGRGARHGRPRCMAPVGPPTPGLRGLGRGDPGADARQRRAPPSGIRGGQGGREPSSTEPRSASGRPRTCRAPRPRVGGGCSRAPGHTTFAGEVARARGGPGGHHARSRLVARPGQDQDRLAGAGRCCGPHASAGDVRGGTRGGDRGGSDGRSDSGDTDHRGSNDCATDGRGTHGRGPASASIARRACDGGCRRSHRGTRPVLSYGSW